MPERAAAATASVDMPGWSACSGKQTVSEGSAVIATVAGQIQAKDYAAALAMLEASTPPIEFNDEPEDVEGTGEAEKTIEGQNVRRGPGRPRRQAA